MVTLLVTSGSASRSSGTTSTTGVSSSTRPSSTSWRTTVAVQTFVTEPIWNSDVVVAGDPGRQVERAVRRLDELVLPTGRVAQDAELGAGDLVPLRQGREAVLPVPGVDPGAAAADGVLLDPVEDPAVEVEPLRRGPEQDEHVGGVRVEHQLGRHVELAQRRVPLLGLADRAGEVGGAVDDERGRPHVGDLGQRRHRCVPRRALPRRAPELVGREEVAVVAGAAHADQVADDSARDRRREPVVVAGQVAGHEAAVAVAGDRQPLRVGESLGDELVDGLEEVVGVRDAPRAVHPVVELLAVAVAAARVDEQDRPAAGGQLLVVEVDLVGRGVPGVVRPAVDVDEEGQRSRSRSGSRTSQRLHLGAVADGEGALDALERLDVGEARAVLGQHGLGGRWTRRPPRSRRTTSACRGRPRHGRRRRRARTRRDRRRRAPPGRRSRRRPPTRGACTRARAGRTGSARRPSPAAARPGRPGHPASRCGPATR